MARLFVDGIRSNCIAEMRKAAAATLWYVRRIAPSSRKSRIVAYEVASEWLETGTILNNEVSAYAIGAACYLLAGRANHLAIAEREPHKRRI